MKIRWTQNSIRFRITPSELASLQSGDTISESLCVVDDMVWNARVEPQSDDTRLVFAKGVLCLHLSAFDLTQLLAPDAEGVYFSRGDLRYFIEKDFPCAHPRANEVMEMESETFIAPAGFEERKNS